VPKIRGVKPDLWTDEDFVELSPYARLLWIGLWNYACDNGHIQDKSKQIKMRVLPTDDVNCAELLREIEGQGLIERADGWLTIPNLLHHQKPHKRWFVTCDKAGCDMPDGYTYGFSKPGSTVEQPLSNGEQPLNNGGSTADVDGDVDGELMVKVTSTSSDKSDHTPDRFDEFWNTYGHKVGRKKCEVAYRNVLKKQQATEALLISSAAAYRAWCLETDTYMKNPLTWLHGEHWTDERPARQAAQSRPDAFLASAQRLHDREQPTMGELA
jgi:hypothetical protein